MGKGRPSPEEGGRGVSARRGEESCGLPLGLLAPRTGTGWEMDGAANPSASCAGPGFRGAASVVYLQLCFLEVVC